MEALANPHYARSCGADGRVWRPGSAQSQGTPNPVRRPSCVMQHFLLCPPRAGLPRRVAQQTGGGQAKPRLAGWRHKRAERFRKKCTHSRSLSHRLPWHINVDVTLDGVDSPWLSDARPAMARGRSSSPADSDLVPNGTRPKPPASFPCLIATKLTLNVLATPMPVMPRRADSQSITQTAVFRHEISPNGDRHRWLGVLGDLASTRPRRSVPSAGHDLPTGSWVGSCLEPSRWCRLARISLGNVKHHYSFPPPPVV